MRRLVCWPAVLLLGASGVIFALAACSSFSGSLSGSRIKPVGVGHLAVADWGNGRVLIFDAPFTTGENASIVLGQPNFDSAVWGEAPNVLFGPMGLAVDASGNLYVADYNNGRVMQFRPPFQNGMNASIELGVPTFSSLGDMNDLNCYKDPPAMSLCMPAGVTLDSGGNVWVADTWDGRAVEYLAPITQAMDASLAIGQPTLNETADCDGLYLRLHESPAGSRLTGSEFCQPQAGAFDSNGDLWVADGGNNRVLEFAPPFATGMTASLELGYPAQEGMTATTQYMGCQTAPVSAATLCGPAGLAFDARGNLWVADSSDQRVIEFSPPFPDGMSASLVIGQPDFTHNESQPSTANSLNYPDSLTFDADGDLVVSDHGNSRVLIFVPPFSNGMSATVVIGQSDMNGGTEHGCGVVNGKPDDPGASGFCRQGGVLVF
jgi:sugar lactone lactonase YvrE